MAFFERAVVVGPDLASESGSDLEPTERGDDVLVVQTTSERYQLHLRRGMNEEDIAEGLRTFANVIESDA